LGFPQVLQNFGLQLTRLFIGEMEKKCFRKSLTVACNAKGKTLQDIIYTKESILIPNLGNTNHASRDAAAPYLICENMMKVRNQLFLKTCGRLL